LLKNQFTKSKSIGKARRTIHAIERITN